MPSVKLNKHDTEGNSNQNEKANEESFNKALKSFQKISQETKRQTKRHEYYVSPRVERRAKLSAAKKLKRRK